MDRELDKRERCGVDGRGYGRRRQELLAALLVGEARGWRARPVKASDCYRALKIHVEDVLWPML
jgi:hypothetical protein